MSALLYTVLAIGALLLIRNELVYKMNMRRIAEIHAAIQRAIDQGQFAYSMFAAYDEMPSYDAQLFDLSKWSYAQFFPKSSTSEGR
jgi:hypothetical protein